MNDLEELSPKQVTFLNTYLQTGSVKEARKEAGVSIRQGTRYMNDNVFQRVLNQQKKELLDGVTYQLQQASIQAIETLIEIMNDEEAPASVRVSASRSILENMYKSIEFTDIVERLEALEEKKGVSDETSINEYLEAIE